MNVLLVKVVHLIVSLLLFVKRNVAFNSLCVSLPEPSFNEVIVILDPLSRVVNHMALSWGPLSEIKRSSVEPFVLFVRGLERTSVYLAVWKVKNLPKLWSLGVLWD